MFTLLVIIYFAFISLGLPDALLGSSWTVMHQELNAPVALAGVIGMTIAGGTIVSSLMTSRILQRFSSGVVVIVSVAMTAVALFGFSIANSIGLLMVFAIPLGLGAGAVDATLNNFVALHYKARHMNWLHSFWGIGAAGGPLIMALILNTNGGWREGYSTVAIIQVALLTMLIISLSKWKTVKLNSNVAQRRDAVYISNRETLRIKGVKIALITFFCYCSLEAGTGLWVATYLTSQKGITPADAALWTSMYYGGITVGRFISGAISEKIDTDKLIEYGLLMIGVGLVAMIIPHSGFLSLMGLILIGLGCAPIYPGMIHLTPMRFGEKASQSIIGLSMAFAYVGSTFMPPIIGGLSALFSLKILPYILMLFVVGMYFSSESVKKNRMAEEMDLLEQIS